MSEIKYAKLKLTQLLLIAFLLYCLLILVTSFTVFAVYRFYLPHQIPSQPAPICGNS